MSYLNAILQQYGFDEYDSSNIIEALKGVEIDEDASTATSAIATLEWLNEQLQAKFIRASGAERQQLVDVIQSPGLRADTICLLSAFTREIMTGADDSIKILLGATEVGVRNRLDTLLDITKEGHSTTIVYPLGGERELWPIQEEATAILLAERLAAVSGMPLEETLNEVNESFREIFAESIRMKESIKNDANKSAEDKLKEQAALVAETNNARQESVRKYTDKGIIWPTETDMMNKVIQEYKDKHPEFQGIDFKPVINAPKNSKGGRPNTLDTLVKMWNDHGMDITVQASQQPSGKLSMSIISGQPEVHYQYHQTVSAFYDKPIKISAVAAGASTVNLNLSVVFDNMARMIHSGKPYITKELEHQRSSFQEKEVTALGMAL